MLLYGPSRKPPSLKASRRHPSPMRLRSRYILSEILGPFFIALMAFSLIVLVHRLSRLTDLVLSKGVPASLVGSLLLSIVPVFLQVILPAALLLSVLLALGRMSADAETTALRAAGVGPRSFVLPVMIVATAAFLSSLLIGWSGIAWGQRSMQETLAKIVAAKAGAGATDHAFQEVAPGVLLFPDRVSDDGSRLTGIFLAHRVPGKPDPVVVTARDGVFVPQGEGRAPALRLSSGTLLNEDPARDAFRLASFETLELHLPETASGFAGSGSPHGMTVPQLSRKVSDALDPKDAASYRYHLHRRLSMAFSCLAFGLLAVPLALSQKSRGRSPAVALTIATIVAYYLFIAAAGAFESRMPLLMVALLWAPNALAVVACGVIYGFDRSRIEPLSVVTEAFRRARGGVA